MKIGSSRRIIATLTLLLLLGQTAAVLAQSGDNSSQLTQKQKQTQATIHYNDALGDISDDDPDSAIQELKTTVSIEPNDGLAWVLLGSQFSDQHDIDDARLAWRNAIKYGDGAIQREARRSLAYSDLQMQTSFFTALALFLGSFGWFYFRAPYLARRAEALPDNRIVTPPLGGFNFGICWLAFFWGIANSIKGALLSLIPVIGIPVQIYYGFAGQRAAWNGPREQSARDFALTQLAWARWATWTMVLIGIVALSLYNLPISDPTTPFGFRGGLILLLIAATFSAFSLRGRNPSIPPTPRA